MRRIAQDVAAGGDWVIPQLRIPSGGDPLKLAAGLSLTLRGREGPEPHTALTELLVEVGRAAITHEVVALVHLDEVQNIVDESALSQLLIALGDAITHEEVVTLPGGARVTRFLPLAVYLTGLPDFEDRAGGQKGATVARRFKTTVLTAIDDDDIVAALQDFVLGQLPPRERTVTRIAQEIGLSRATEVGTTAQRLDTVRGIIDRGKLYGFRHRAMEAYMTSDWPRVE